MLIKYKGQLKLFVPTYLHVNLQSCCKSKCTSHPTTGGIDLKSPTVSHRCNHFLYVHVVISLVGYMHSEPAVSYVCTVNISNRGSDYYVGMAPVQNGVFAGDRDAVFRP